MSADNQNPVNTQVMILEQLKDQAREQKRQSGQLAEMNNKLSEFLVFEERQNNDRIRIRALEASDKDRQKEISESKAAQAEEISEIRIEMAKKSGRDGVLWPWLERAIAALILGGVMWIAAGGKVNAGELYLRGGFGLHPDLTANLPTGWGVSDYNDRLLGHFAAGYRFPINNWITGYAEAEHVSDPGWKDPGAGLNWIKGGIEYRKKLSGSKP